MVQYGVVDHQQSVISIVGVSCLLHLLASGVRCVYRCRVSTPASSVAHVDWGALYSRDTPHASYVRALYTPAFFLILRTKTFVEAYAPVSLLFLLEHPVQHVLRNRTIFFTFCAPFLACVTACNCEKGDSLLLDDGKLRMTVVDSGEGYVNCRVDIGGKLSNKKGVNTPTVRLPISAMTPKVMWRILTSFIDSTVVHLYYTIK